MTDHTAPPRAHRIAGALLGVHAGDSLGATVEFSSWAEIKQRYPDGLAEIVGGGPFNWPAGHATDDTDGSSCEPLTRCWLTGVGSVVAGALLLSLSSLTPASLRTRLSVVSRIVRHDRLRRSRMTSRVWGQSRER